MKKDTTQQDSLTKLWDNESDKRWDTTQQIKEDNVYFDSDGNSSSKEYNWGFKEGRKQAIEEVFKELEEMNLNRTNDKWIKNGKFTEDSHLSIDAPDYLKWKKQKLEKMK